MDEEELGLSEALKTTGFPFEHYAFMAAQESGWSTRSSRLYIDPDEHKTREMDLLCYRVSRGREITTCTALIISCKARNAKPWVLLTRPWPDRRSTWYPYPPVSLWTNSDPLRFEIEQPEWAINYFNLAEATGLQDWARDSVREVFALHEFENVQGKNARGGDGAAAVRFRAIGDSSLYEGTMSLLKALAYELKTVPERKAKSKEQIVYQFNLIQLLDGELFEAAFGGAGPNVKRIDRYRYFARTMLGGRDFSARIDFCTRSRLKGLLSELTRLHQFNALHFDGRIDDFYRGLMSSPQRIQAVTSKLESHLRPYVLSFSNALPEHGWVHISPGLDQRSADLVLWLDRDVVNQLRKSQGFSRAVARAMHEIFRFDGTVNLREEDIPF